MKFLSVLFVCLLVSGVASATLLCPFTAPVIDGIIAPGEWDSAQTFDLQVMVPGGGTTPARLYFLNDEKFLYLALRLRRDKPDYTSKWQVTLDSDHDGWSNPGDDVLTLFHNYTDPDRATDAVNFAGGTCSPPVICQGADTDFGGRNDVTGAVGSDGTYVMFELSKPLAAQDAFDANMPPGSSIGIRFWLELRTETRAWGGVIWPDDHSFVPYAIRDCTIWR